MTTPIIVLPITGTVDPALLRGIKDLGESLRGVGASAEQSSQQTQQSTSAVGSAASAATNAVGALTGVAFAYNQITAAIAQVISTVDGIARLAGEQDRLSAQARELGLDFDAAAESAGIFSDEVDALGAAATFANADIRLTQQELNALERVAGANAARLGISVTQSVETLTQALIRGRESGLQRYGHELAEVAGGSHTVGERLEALVRVAGHTTQATDNSATAFERLKDRLDDYKRTAASAFMDELNRMISLGESTDRTGESMRDLANTIGGVASAIATMIAMAVGGIRYLVTEAIALHAQALNSFGLVGDVETREAQQASRDALDNLEAMQANREGVGAGVQQVGGGTRRLAGTETSDRTRRLRPGVSYQPRNAAEAEAMRTAEADAVARNSRDAAAASADRAGSSRAAAEATKDEAAKLAEIADLQQRATQEVALRARAERDAVEYATRARASVDALIAAEERRSLDAKRLEGEMANLSNERRRAAEDAAKLGDSKEVREADSTLTMFARNVESIEAVFARVGDTTHAFFRALIDDSLSAGDALQKWVHDSLSALSEVASREAIMSLGKGLSALFTNPPAAAAHFAAAAAFGAVAIGAGAAAGAVGSPQASAAAAGAGGTSRRTSSDRAANDNGDIAPIHYHYYAPVIGGREASDEEIGTRLGRYDARSRRRASA